MKAVLQNESTGERRELGETTLIGRLDDCDLVVRDSKISRKHAMIRLQDDGYRLYDLGSANGCLLNGKRITSNEKLTNADVLRFGSHNPLSPLSDPFNGDLKRPNSKSKFLATRLDDCDLVVRDSKISRKHAMIRLQDDGYRLYDLGSANGCLLNGKRITSNEKLTNADVLRFGSHNPLSPLSDPFNGDLKRPNSKSKFLATPPLSPLSDPFNGALKRPTQKANS